MKAFVVYKSSGKILRYGSCPDEMVDIQASAEDGEHVIEGEATFEHYVDEGVILPMPPRPSQYHVFDYAEKAWGLKATALDDAKAQQAALINQACQSEIYAGFDSAALGSVHHYPAKAQDQANLVASVTASLLPANQPDWLTPFWCADDQNAWAYTMHTASQIQQTGSDGKAAILAALGKNEALQQQIAAGVSIEDVHGVMW